MMKNIRGQAGVLPDIKEMEERADANIEMPKRKISATTWVVIALIAIILIFIIIEFIVILSGPRVEEGEAGIKGEEAGAPKSDELPEIPVAPIGAEITPKSDELPEIPGAPAGGEIIPKSDELPALP